jgi:hypothetical protein
METHEQLVLELKKTHPKHYCKMLKNNYPEIWAEIERFCEPIIKDSPLGTPQMIFHWINKLDHVPTCPVKGVPLKFRYDKFQYRRLSERGLIDDEMMTKRKKNRTHFPNAEQRLQGASRNFDYEPGYEKIALETVKDMIKSIVRIGGVCSSLKTKKNLKLYHFICTRYPDTTRFTECLYRFVNGLDKAPKCPYTNKPIPFTSFEKGYKEYHIDALGYIKSTNKKQKILTSSVLNKEQTIQGIKDLVELLEQQGLTVNNLKQSAIKHNPSLINSVNIHTKEYETVTDKWSERAYLLIHSSPKDITKVRFVSFDEGYYDTYVNPKSSAGEQDLKAWISSLRIGKVTQHQRILDGMEIDVFVSSRSFGIEYHGEYFHNFEFRGDLYHKQKADISEVHGIDLVQVFESEWHNKQDIIKSIVRSKFGLRMIEICARTCEIKQLDTKTKNKFLEHNHIKGADRTPIAFGLFHQGDLVSCATFKQTRSKKDREFEMVRFCNRINTSVTGALDVMVERFVDVYSPLNLITLVDRRFNMESALLRSAGFIKTICTEPDHFYLKPTLPQYMKLMHHHAFAKHLLPKKLKHYDLSLTVYENMKNNGYYKVYDAGSFVYEKRF